MPERLRKETINSWFYPAIRGEIPGIPLIASPRAIQNVMSLEETGL